MGATDDLSLEELDARAAALEQELAALRSVIAMRRAQASLPPSGNAVPSGQSSVASSVRLAGYLSNGVVWDVAVPFSSIGRAHGATIGRDTEIVDFSLPEDSVSRRHVRLMLNERGLAVSDLGSTNGTYVNGRPLLGDGTPAPLTDGDTLTLGTLNLRVALLF